MFVNRALRLDVIRYYGFDMDYTVAVYKQPEYDILVYELVLSRLLELGYPSSLADLSYDADFPIRGLFVDTELGNLLKIGRFGEIIIW